MLRRLMRRAYVVGSALTDRWATTARQWLLADTAALDPACRIYRSASLESLGGDPGAIRIGANTHVRANLLVLARGGRISVGDWCYLGEGTRLWSASEIVVEDRVLIAHGCDIHDWNAHPIDARERHDHYRRMLEQGHSREADNVGNAPIRIREDAWIGFGSTILKGVTIGARSVVASRSLVLDDVPDDTLVGGIPARPMRTLSRPDDGGDAR
jgi:acetyltransferase-like isoleucine patch superfamily enzyme